MRARPDPEEGDFIALDDVGVAVVTALQQPRRIPTALRTVGGVAEAD